MTPELDKAEAAPERLWLNPAEGGRLQPGTTQLREPWLDYDNASWSEERLSDNDVEYVLAHPSSRDDVLEEAARIVETHISASAEMAAAAYYSSAESAVLNTGRGIAAAIRAAKGGGR